MLDQLAYETNDPLPNDFMDSPLDIACCKLNFVTSGQYKHDSDWG